MTLRTVFLTCAVAGCAFSQPFLNLDFEVTTRGRIRGWPAPTGSVTGVPDTTTFKSGKTSYRLRNGATTGQGFSQISYPAVGLIGRKIRLSGSVRTEGVANTAAFYLRADSATTPSLEFVTLQGRTGAPQGTADWRDYELEITVPPQAANITMGVLLLGGGTAWFDSFSLEADGVAVPQGPEPFIGEPSPAQLEWIRNNAIPLQSTRTGTGFKDLAPLKQVIGDARVVGLGENSYGVADFKRLKTRLIEYLTGELGFNIVAVEANLPEAYKLNDYVLTGEGDPKALLGSLYYWFYASDEMLELVQWMREFNASGRGRVQFTGFDMQYPLAAGDIVRRFVEETDPGYLTTLDPIYIEMGKLDELPVTSATMNRFRQSIVDTGKVREYLESKYPDAAWHRIRNRR